MKKAPNRSPLRRALREGSTLHASVADGMAAVQAAHRNYFEPAIRTDFADSLDLDAAMRPAHGHANRWDYLLGHAPSGQLVAVEPHSAKQDEITTVINKRKAAREQLQPHLREGARITTWLWVASGKVHFANTEKARLILDQNGIKFVGTRVAQRDLPPAAATAPAQPRKRR